MVWFPFSGFSRNPGECVPEADRVRVCRKTSCFPQYCLAEITVKKAPDVCGTKKDAFSQRKKHPLVTYSTQPLLSWRRCRNSLPAQPPVSQNCFPPLVRTRSGSKGLAHCLLSSVQSSPRILKFMIVSRCSVAQRCTNRLLFFIQ